ncbi:MAG: DUF1987 domain-containing protein [Cyclobacteriaceae bacterium]|nr:DUF1987 domain-containing protein [Cyclobacteriaceae bacterium]
MQNLELERTDLTPYVVLNATTGNLYFEGRAVADTMEDFFKPVHGWLKEYCKKPAAATILTARFEYVNTATQRELLDILKTMEGLLGARVVWQFLEDDEDMEECGQELAQLTKIPFDFETY